MYPPGMEAKRNNFHVVENGLKGFSSGLENDQNDRLNCLKHLDLGIINNYKLYEYIFKYKSLF